MITRMNQIKQHFEDIEKYPRSLFWFTRLDSGHIVTRGLKDIEDFLLSEDYSYLIDPKNKKLIFGIAVEVFGGLTSAQKTTLSTPLMDEKSTETSFKKDLGQFNNITPKTFYDNLLNKFKESKKIDDYNMNHKKQRTEKMKRKVQYDDQLEKFFNNQTSATPQYKKLLNFMASDSIKKKGDSRLQINSKSRNSKTLLNSFHSRKPQPLKTRERHRSISVKDNYSGNKRESSEPRRLDRTVVKQREKLLYKDKGKRRMSPASNKMFQDYHMRPPSVLKQSKHSEESGGSFSFGKKNNGSFVKEGVSTGSAKKKQPKKLKSKLQHLVNMRVNTETSGRNRRRSESKSFVTGSQSTSKKHYYRSINRKKRDYSESLYPYRVL